jgi:hypothetical protein
VNVELTSIAESKIRQMGGDVCGVLVRKDGRLAAVDEHGRVQWLQDDGGEYAAYLEGANSHLKADLEAARAQSGEVEPVARVNNKPWPKGVVPVPKSGRWYSVRFLSDEEDGDLPDGTLLYAHAHPSQQGSVPEGWKLVPVEPTATMISAFEHAPCAENYTDAATWAWEAMLDATPQPPQEGSGDEH